MIEIIGKGRIVYLAVFAALAVIIWGGGAVTVFPMGKDARSDYKKAKKKTEEYTKRLARIDTTVGLLEERGGDYEKINASGFVGEQDRLRARRKIQEVRILSEIPSLTYKMEKETTKPHALANKAKYLLRQSPVNIELVAYSDIDVWNFVEKLEAEYPGQLVLNNIEVKMSEGESAADVDEKKDSVAVFQEPRLKASMTFSWNTVVEDDGSERPSGDDMGGLNE